MASSLAAPDFGAVESVLRDSLATLRNVAAYRLPAALDRRLLWLSENKESLTAAEREELLAMVEFAEDRTLEKLQASALLKKCAHIWPQVLPSQP